MQTRLSIKSAAITTLYRDHMTSGKIRTPCHALVAHIASLLLRTVGGDLGEQIYHLGIASALLDQARHRIATFAPALVAGDLQRIELADQFANDDRAVCTICGGRVHSAALMPRRLT